MVSDNITVTAPSRTIAPELQAKHDAARDRRQAAVDALVNDADATSSVNIADLIAIGGTAECTAAEVAKLGITGDPGITLSKLATTHPDTANIAARWILAGRPKPGSTKPLHPPKDECAHRGQPTGDTIQCDTCNGKVMLKVLTCTVHGKCVQAKPQAGIAGCRGCKDRVASSTVSAPA